MYSRYVTVAYSILWINIDTTYINVNITEIKITNLEYNYQVVCIS